LPQRNNWENIPELKKDEEFILTIAENNCQIQETAEGRFLFILDEKEFS
jgi:hypothetical protein